MNRRGFLGMVAALPAVPAVAKEGARVKPAHVVEANGMSYAEVLVAQSLLTVEMARAAVMDDMARRNRE